MRSVRKTNLINEFLRDHQRLVRLLRDVVVLVENGKIAAARPLAEELNCVAGPHIAFEEKVLYPTTKAAHGDEFERKLLAEHSNARGGLVQLLSASDVKLRKPEFRQRVATALRAGLKHAESCGTLVSHLEQLSEEDQHKALATLNGLKHEGRPWAEGLR